MISRALKVGLERRFEQRNIELEIASYGLNADLRREYERLCQLREYVAYLLRKSFLKEEYGLDDNQFKALTLYTFGGSRAPRLIDGVFQSLDTDKISELSTLIMWIVSGMRKLPRCRTPGRFTAIWEVPYEALGYRFSGPSCDIAFPFVQLVSTAELEAPLSCGRPACYLQVSGDFVAYDTTNFTESMSAILDCGTALRVVKQEPRSNYFLFYAEPLPYTPHLSYMGLPPAHTQQQQQQDQDVCVPDEEGCITLFSAAREFCEMKGCGERAEEFARSLVADSKLVDLWMKMYLMPREEVHVLNSFLGRTFFDKGGLFYMVNEALSAREKGVGSFVALLYSALERIGKRRVTESLHFCIDRKSYNQGCFVSTTFLQAFDCMGPTNDPGSISVEVVCSSAMSEPCVYTINSYHIFPPNTLFYTIYAIKNVNKVYCIAKSAPSPERYLAAVRKNNNYGVLNNSINSSIMGNSINLNNSSVMGNSINLNNSINSIIVDNSNTVDSFMFKIDKSINCSSYELVSIFREALQKQKGVSGDTWVEYLDSPFDARTAYMYVRPCSLEDMEKLSKSPFLRVGRSLFFPSLVPKVEIPEAMIGAQDSWMNVVGAVNKGTEDCRVAVELYEVSQSIQGGRFISPKTKLLKYDQYTVSDLDCSGNELSDFSMESISYIIMNNKSINSINLSHNKIQYNGLKYLINRSVWVSQNDKREISLSFVGNPGISRDSINEFNSMASQAPSLQLELGLPVPQSIIGKIDEALKVEPGDTFVEITLRYSRKADIFILKRKSGAEGEQIVDAKANDAGTFRIDGLLFDTEYLFHSSGMRDELAFVTKEAQAPENVQAAVAGPRSVMVSWKMSACPAVDDYEVEVDKGLNTQPQAFTVAKDTGSYELELDSIGTVYRVRVRIRYGGGKEGVWSNHVPVMLPCPGVENVVTFEVTDTSYGISWDEIKIEGISYEVYLYLCGSDSDIVVTSEQTTAASYKFGNLGCGCRYKIEVYALVNSAKSSPYSKEFVTPEIDISKKFNNIEKLSPEDLIYWISLYMDSGDFINPILNNKITGKKLLAMNESDLEEVGVSYGDVIKIFSALEKIKASTSRSSARAAGFGDVNIGESPIVTMSRFVSPDKSKPILFYCGSVIHILGDEVSKVIRRVESDPSLANLNSTDIVALVLFARIKKNDINDVLTTRNTNGTRSLIDLILMIMAALRKLPRVPTTQCLYFLAPMVVFANKSLNTTYSYPGFMTASIEPPAVQKPSDVVVKIEGGFVGYDLSKFVEDGDGWSVVLEPETQYKIIPNGKTDKYIRINVQDFELIEKDKVLSIQKRVEMIEQCAGTCDWVTEGALSRIYTKVPPTFFMTTKESLKMVVPEAAYTRIVADFESTIMKDINALDYMGNKGITPDEALAVYAFTYGASKIEMPGYRVNECLNERNPSSLFMYRGFILNLASVLGKIGAPFCGTLYRTSSMDSTSAKEKYKDGTVYTWPAFTTAFTDLRAAKSLGGSVVFVINVQVPAGHHVNYISAYKERNGDRGGLTYIYMTLKPGEPAINPRVINVFNANRAKFV